jgi:hypothetical protein
MASSKKKSDSRDTTNKDPERLGERPEIIVEFLFNNGLFFICVRNIGQRPALKVSAKFDNKITGANDRLVSALPLFENIEFIGPQREITTFVDTSASYFERKQPTKLSVVVSYTDPENHKYETTIEHDLEIYRGLSYVPSVGETLPPS